MAILTFPDNTQNHWRREMGSIVDAGIELAAYNAYAFQRSYSRLTPEQLLKIGFMGWSEEKIRRTEAIYQEAIKNERS